MEDLPEHDTIGALTVTFLDAHRELVVENLSERLRQAGETSLLPIHCALLNAAAAHIREPSRGGGISGVHQVLAEYDLPPETKTLISGQIILWEVLHGMLRELEGPHRSIEVVHSVLALAGNAIDGIIGVLLAFDPSGNERSVAPLAWGSLMEFGRGHREFQTLNRIVRNLLETPDPAEMLGILERGLLGTFHIRSVCIAIANHTDGYLEVVCCYPLPPLTRDPIGWRYSLSDPEIFCDVVRTGRTEVIDGWDPRFHERVVGADGSISFRRRPSEFNEGNTSFFVPIAAGGRTVGVISTGSTQGSKGIVLREIERMRPFLDQVGMAVTIGTEIAERRRMEMALRESEERYRSLYVDSRDAVMIVSPDRGFLAGNPTTVKLFGCLDERDFTARTPAELSPEVQPNGVSSKDKAQQMMGIALREGSHFFEWIHKRKDGREFPATVLLSRLEGGGKPVLQATVRDITEQKRAEGALLEAKQKQVLVETAGAAAHEIYQPLTAIVGFSQLLKEEMAPDAPQRESLEIIEGAGKRIQRIVDQMVSLQQYVTKPYVEGVEIVDFDASSRQKSVKEKPGTEETNHEPAPKE